MNAFSELKKNPALKGMWDPSQGGVAGLVLCFANFLLLSLLASSPHTHRPSYTHI